MTLELLDGIYQCGVRMRHHDRIQLGGKARGRHTRVLRAGYLADGMVHHPLQYRRVGAGTYA
ncbi:hypothetical protein [Mycobacterium sp. SMC-13]|uniref:hypothetical protein n=1 Tax=Mycobacterium sp. SMC-13 TaxID=3381626 RepID=UPI0038770171